jgi:ATP-dependent helicase/nuclease subunit A
MQPDKTVTRTSAIQSASHVQFEAATPSHSAWVEASAGSGKTRVLTNRVLRMLLSGVAPHKILCLTYTKSAAANMALRLGKDMAKWATMPESKLTLALEELTGHAPDDEMLRLARTLFTRILESPGGLQIQTIHGFCQSVLARFPIEANVPTGFTVLDGAAAITLRQACLHRIYQQSWLAPNTPEGIAIMALLKDRDSKQLLKLLDEVLLQRDIFEQLFAHYHGAGLAVAALYKHYGLSGAQDEQSFIEEITCFDPALEEHMRQCLTVAQIQNEAKYQDMTDQLHLLLTGTAQQKSDIIFGINAFVTKDNTIKAAFKKTLKNKNPFLIESETAIGSYIIHCRETRALRQTCQATASLYVLASALLKDFKESKRLIGGLDFDDLISHTAQLFASNSSAWVLYKLDGGIDHVLVDEAQDTNSTQWDILKVITSEFFSGSGTHENAPLPPSIFAVGDYKQSIFSFMGAEPESFKAAKEHYHQVLQVQNRQLVVRAFRTSFRTAQPVLSFVDGVFTQEIQAQGLFNYQSHISAYEGLAGHIEVWPSAVKVKTDKDSETPPLLPAPLRLARKIADEIERMVTGRIMLEKENRPITYGDIMVLIPKRTGIADAIVRSCKRKGIPITGKDKMILQSELAVMDIMALLNFALLPDDNLTLATLLRSPLIDLSEDNLLTLASTRPVNASLWSHLKRLAEQGDVLWSAIAAYLDIFLAKADFVSPYEMVSSILSSPCPASARGGRHAMLKRLGNECRDPLDELLNAVLVFESGNTPSLQVFCRHMESVQLEIKRQLEQSHGEVRVMTVHGSKGLESPVVIIADLESRGPAQSSIGIAPPHLHSLHPFPLCRVRGGVPQDLHSLQQAQMQIESEESNRLLYVALTRAEERLIITSCNNSKTAPDEHGWSEAARRALKSFEHIQPLSTQDFPAEDGWIGSGYLYYKPATTKPATSTHQEEETHAPAVRNVIDILQQHPWLFTKAAAEKPLSRPLTASTALDEEPGLSPLAGDQVWKFKRGHIIHRLLQTLPALPQSEQAIAARNWLATQDVPHKEQIIAEVLDVLHTPDYAPLFGSHSRAEVPLTGIVGDDVVSGQIDRLAITADEVWIVDYKTNRPAAVALDEVPTSYLRQLALYKALLKKLYPAHKLRTFLLWTNLPKLVEIPEEYTAKALSAA